MNRTRKATLLRLLTQMDEDWRTPGEEAAIAISIQLVLASNLKTLDKAAARIEKYLKCFWSKQW